MRFPWQGSSFWHYTWCCWQHLPHSGIGWRGLVALLLAVEVVNCPAPAAGQAKNNATNGNPTLTLTLNPTTVYQGNIAVGTVTISPLSGVAQTIALSSSNTSVATVPTTVTIPANKSSAIFNVTTNTSLTKPTSAKITASYLTLTASATLTVNIQLPLPTVVNPGVTWMQLPNTMRLDWTYPTPPVPCYFTWARTCTNPKLNANGTTTNTYLVDTPLDFSASYGYTFTAVPNDPNNLTNGYHYISSAASAISVVPVQLNATDNQTVDARYDPRYSTYVFVDHNFGTSGYRGGLFCGVAPGGDNSRIGRTFLRFTNLPNISSTGVMLWPATLNLYCPGAAATNTTGWTVGVQPITDNGWTLSNLTWDSAPTFDPTQYTSQTTITYDQSNPSAAWYAWPLPTDFIDACSRQQTSLCLGLADINEATDVSGGVTSWLYFVRKEARSSLAPCLLYATGAPLRIMNIVLSAYTVKGGSPVTGQVFLNGNYACTVGIVVTSNSSSATIVGNATPLPGTCVGNFAISTTAVTTPTPVTITANLGPGTGSAQNSVSVTLTVTP